MDFAVVEICNEPVNRTGVSRSSGQPYDIWFQEAYLHQPGVPYPEKFEFLLRSGVVFSPGKYAVTARAFYVDRDGRLAVRLEDGMKPLEVALSDAKGGVSQIKAAA